MKEILLDRSGINPVRDGYLLVNSEVDFLNLAISDNRLQVRGPLCDWARIFCEARQISYNEIVSPVLEITSICPVLSSEQAEKIYSSLQPKKFDSIERPLTISKLLNAISPGKLWQDEPSVRHSAEWLLWLIEFNPKVYLQPALRELCDFWIRHLDSPENIAYNATDATMARDILNNWLGIVHQSSYAKLADFPITVPVKIKSGAREYWNRKIVESKGAYIVDTTSWPAQSALKKVLAEEAFKYFKTHKGNFNAEKFNLLTNYLSWQEQQDLQILLPPSGVSEVPDTPSAILEWFLKEYLPYRSWQFGKDNEDAKQILAKLARDFGLWYLENYPRALSGGEMARNISFNKTTAVSRESQQFVTLIIVMDGLHVGDGHSFKLKIQELAPRLSLLSDDLAFTALPTVTEFCKPALFKGVKPVDSDQVQPIGEIVPESVMPVSKLSNAHPGEVYLWRIQEPDHTYHSKNKFDALMRKVESEIDSSAKTVQDIVEQVPSEIPLQIVITTDHGRIIGISKRKIPVPPGMESHGRAAWGKSNLAFNELGYLIQNEIAFLSAERFGMLYDIAIPLNDDAFFTSDGRSGHEAFTHGGMYPEEVIIPWITFVRDYEKPVLRIIISGVADAGKPGTLLVTINNYADVDVILAEVVWDFGTRREQKSGLLLNTTAQDIGKHKIEIQKWPTNIEIGKSRCVFHIKQPNGLLFTIDAEIDVTSNEMYGDYNILEGMV